MSRTVVVLLAVMSACSSSVPAPSLRSVEPHDVFQQADTFVEISGEFRSFVKVDFQTPGGSTRNAQFGAQLERGELIVGLFDVTFLGPGHLSARVPAGLEAGPWALRLTDPLLRQVRLEDAVVVVDCSQTTCRLSDGGVVDGGPIDPFRDGGADAGPEEDAGPPDAGPQPCAMTTLKDDDLDGYGVNGSEAMLCGAGRTTMGGDCDDVDPGVHVGAPELCNRIDDDCDGQIDEGNVCPVMNPAWVRRLDATPLQSWRTVSMFAVGQGWIAGRDDVWGRLDGGYFEPSSLGCPNEIEKSWANVNGDLYVGGGNPALGRLATHLKAGAGCMDTRMLSDPIAGLWGAPSDAGLRLTGALHNTRRFDLVPPGQPVESATNLGTADLRFEDVHQAAGAVYAVGSSEGAEMRAWSLGANGNWNAQAIGRTGLPQGSLRAVWVLSGTSVFAVGDRGAAIEKIGTAWRRLPAPTNATLTSVVAFNPARVYVTGSDGTVRKWNGRAWQLLYSNDGGAALNDLGGVSESDLWAVGDRGWIVHWAE